MVEEVEVMMCKKKRLMRDVKYKCRQAQRQWHRLYMQVGHLLFVI